MVEAMDAAEAKKHKEKQEAMLRCKEGHKIVAYQNGFKRRQGPNGTVIQPRDVNLKCKCCDSAFQIGA